MRKLKVGDIFRARNSIAEKQGNRCAICGGGFDEVTFHQTKKKRVKKYKACLDHNHKTGSVRGVLCSYCNSVEGKVINAIDRYHREIKGDDDAISNFLYSLANYYSFHRIDHYGLIHPNFKTDEEKRLLRNKRARMKRKREKNLESSSSK